VPDGSGALSMTLPIDKSTPLGPQMVDASCGQVSTGAGTNIWEYPTAPPIDITSTYSLAVRPGTTVTPGTSLYTSSEGACSNPTPSSPGSYAAIAFGPNANTATYGANGDIPFVSTDGLGNWPTTVVVPPGDVSRSVLSVDRGYSGSDEYELVQPGFHHGRGTLNPVLTPTMATIGGSRRCRMRSRAPTVVSPWHTSLFRTSQ
jgi:hypothetical protein